MESTVSEVEQGIHAVSSAEESFEKINLSVDQVVYEIKDVSLAIQQITNDIARIKESMHSINDFSDTTASNSHQVYHSTEKQLVAIEEMMALVTSLSEIADESYENIQEFKLSNLIYFKNNNEKST